MKLTRDNMAYLYAGLIVSGQMNEEELNKIIMDKWSRSGLLYIKTKAWKTIELLHGKTHD